jgi:hypothetical protein
MAYGRLSSNQGAMTPGGTGETGDGMALEKIGVIINALRRERYRWSPVKRVYIPQKSGTRRPLGLPTWSDKLVAEVVRLLLEAYYDVQFSAHAHGFVPAGAVTPPWTRWCGSGRGHPGVSRAISLTVAAASTTGSCGRFWRRRSTMAGSCG